MQNNNLNIDTLIGTDGFGWKRLKEFKKNNITVHFGNIEEALIKYISKSKTCLGCVAWLTNEKMLTALEKCEIVSIIVQKEDFLRPDYQNTKINWKEEQDAWKLRLQGMYNKLPRGLRNNDFTGFDEFDYAFAEHTGYDFNDDEKNIIKLKEETGISPNDISYACAWKTDAIRCLGEVNKLKLPAFPRMHHKFLIFCNSPTEPYAVWTGSFNFTLNGTQSLENGIFIEDKQIAQAYWNEFFFNFVRSVPLDWNSKYSQQELRIGS